MKILRAEHLGMCFGVKDAIRLAHEQAQSGPLTILGDLVHNESVIADLQSRGIRIAQRPEQAGTHDVMVTAHGASERAKAAARALGLNVIEATCPLVLQAHRALAELVKKGFHPLIIGKRDHVEVRGMTEDLEAYDVVLSEEELHRLQPHEKWGVVAQTTQPIDRVRNLVGLLEQRFPDAKIRFKDTVCRPTKQRQNAAVDLARRCDVVIVIGGANSNNTHELVRACRRHCDRVHHVRTAVDLQPRWFRNAKTVGITAGTSTPDVLIGGVETVIRAFSKILMSGPEPSFNEKESSNRATFHTV